MSRLDRYIGKTVFMASLVVLLVIVGLDALFGFINELDEVSDRYRLQDVIYYSLLNIPRRIYAYIGMSVLVGCLIGLGLMANSSELTVIRAAGISKMRILRAVVQPMLLLVLFGAALGEYVAPQAEREAKALRVELTTGRRDVQVRYGVWHREGDWFMRFQAVRGDGSLLGLTLYEFDDQRRLQLARFAGEASYQEGKWTLKDVSETRFVFEPQIKNQPDKASFSQAQRTEVSSFYQQEWKTGLSPKLLQMLAMEPSLLSIRDLFTYTNYLRDEGLDGTAYELALWAKILNPLAVLGLVLIGFSFIFGPLRSVTMGQRIMAGVMVGMIFKLTQDMLGPASVVFGFSPLLAALTPILVCYGAGWWLLRRAG